MMPVQTETRIDGKLYIVTAECSPAAKETIEKKLERLICRHAADTKSYQYDKPEPLAICGAVREYTTDTIVRE